MLNFFSTDKIFESFLRIKFTQIPLKCGRWTFSYQNVIVFPFNLKFIHTTSCVFSFKLQMNVGQQGGLGWSREVAQIPRDSKDELQNANP